MCDLYNSREIGLWDVSNGGSGLKLFNFPFHLNKKGVTIFTN